MADRQPLVRHPEDDLGRDDEARQPQRVDLGAADRGAARLARARRVLERALDLRRPHLAEPLGQLARGAARRVGLAGARVVDHLPRGQVPRGEQRGGLRHRGGEREVAGRDHADAALAGGGADLVEVVRRQPGGADHHGHAALDRGQRVGLDDVVRREVDQHVDAVERLVDGGVDGRAVRLAAGRRAAHAGAQLEVVGGGDGLRQRAAGPAGDARDADAQGRHGGESSLVVAVHVRMLLC